MDTATITPDATTIVELLDAEAMWPALLAAEDRRRAEAEAAAWRRRTRPEALAMAQLLRDHPDVLVLVLAEALVDQITDIALAAGEVRRGR